MYCLHPVLVKNGSRFLVSSQRERLMHYVRCGKCAACQQNKRAEWTFRAYHQFKDCVSRGGYVYFDTLTYSNDYLPHLKDFDEFADLPSYRNYVCFNHSHLTDFHKRLRIYLRRRFNLRSDIYSYFQTSEYGTDERYTHRPHYHILFFVNSDKIKPVDFSRLVSDAWYYGRTDGVPYKPYQYVMRHVFNNLSPYGQRVIQYVAKYVQKDNGYENQINKRVRFLTYQLINGDLDRLHDDDVRQFELRCKRLVGLFHRQSLGFGVSALDGINETELYQRGYFLMPSIKANMLNKVPIANYYHRKITQYCVTLPDGYKCWSYRLDKLHLLNIRDSALVRNMSNSLRCRFKTANLAVPNTDKLADYLINYQGRLIASLPYQYNDVLFRSRDSDLFLYGSVADKNHFGCRLVSSNYLGYKDNYINDVGCVCQLSDFIEHNTYNQNTLTEFNGFDDIYNKLLDIESCCAPSIDGAYNLKTRLSHIYKSVLQC